MADARLDLKRRWADFSLVNLLLLYLMMTNESSQDQAGRQEPYCFITKRGPAHGYIFKIIAQWRAQLRMCESA